MVSAEERYWRQVPRVNVLSTQRRIPQQNLFFRGLLALIVVLGAFLIMNQRSAKSDVEDRISITTSNLQRQRAQLQNQLAQTDQLRVDINLLNEERQKLDSVLLLVSGSKIDWLAALTAVFEAEIAGILFESVSTNPGQQLVTVAGSATSTEARNGLLPRFNRISHPLAFKNLNWEGGAEGSTFTATFAVSK